MVSITLTNAVIRQHCGERAKYIIEVAREMSISYDTKKGTFGLDYDKEGREDVRKLLRGEYLGDGSKIWNDDTWFVHYDGKSGAINLGEIKEVSK